MTSSLDGLQGMELLSPYIKWIILLIYVTLGIGIILILKIKKNDDYK